MDFKVDNDKELRVGTIYMDGKSMRLDNDIINVNNISAFRIGKVKVNIPYLYYAILLVVALISLMLLPLGLLLLAVFCYLVYKKYKEFMDPNFYLFVFMNDARSFKINVGDVGLLNRISDALIKSINNDNVKQNFILNKSIQNDNHVENHNNSHNSNHVENNDSHDVSVNGSVNGNNQFGTGNYSSGNYSETLIDEIKEAKTKFNDTSDEKMALNALSDAAKTNDESAIKSVLRKFSEIFDRKFISNTFSSFISGVLLNLMN